MRKKLDGYSRRLKDGIRIRMEGWDEESRGSIGGEEEGGGGLRKYRRME